MSLCGYPHLDRIGSLFTRTGVTCARDAGGIFAIRYLLEPYRGVAKEHRLATREPVRLERSLAIANRTIPAAYRFGAQTSIIWSPRKREEAGIHVHAFKGQS